MQNIESAKTFPTFFKKQNKDFQENSQLVCYYTRFIASQNIRTKM